MSPDPRCPHIHAGEDATTEFVSTVDGFRPLPYIVTGVVNGRWIKGALDWMKQNEIEPDLTRRGSW